MIIYKITNTKNNKIYVGKDTHDSPDYLGSGVLIKRAIGKYGKDAFIKEIIEACNTSEELNDRELYWIKNLDCLHPNGYNILVGSTGGDVLTNNPNRDVAIRHMKENAYKRDGELNPFYGKSHTPETINKIISRDRYSTHDKDICMCAACKSTRGLMSGENNPMFGRKHTPESITKMKANRPDYSGNKNPNYKDGRRVKIS